MTEPVYGVPVALAGLEARALLRRIMRDFFEATCRKLYTTSSVGLTPSGIYLPPPDYLWCQDNPSEQQFSDLGHVAAFIGRTGESQLRSTYSRSGEGYVAEVAVPYGISLLFGTAPAPGVQDSVESRPLREEEVLSERTEHYLGALKHLVAAHVNQDRAAYTTEPLSDSLNVSEVRIASPSDPPSLMAQVHYTFSIIQNQIFPLGVGSQP